MTLKKTHSIVVFFSLLLCWQISTKPYKNNDKWKNYCFDGKDPSSWSQKIKLKEFSKGPCSPLFMAPGIPGSKLEILINCEELQKNDPETFSKCGWKHCSPNSNDDEAPKSEYQIWVPLPISPMSILTPIEKNKQCFSGLIGTDYDSSSGKIVYKPRPGVTVKPLGATPKTMTKAEGNCGFKGIENMIPDVPNPEKTAYFVYIRKRLEYMGYESGLTLQGLPYDFRVGNQMDELTKKWTSLMKGMHDLVNKKVMVLAHSMGNLRMSYGIWQMSQEDRDKYIANYIAIAPPFLGASKAILYLTCGSETYELPLDLGIDYPTFSRSIATFASLWQLIPFETYFKQKDADWMKKIKLRIAYENGESEDPVFDFFPKREEICYPKFPSAMNCRSGLVDFGSFGTTMNGEEITAENFKEMMGKLSPSPNIESLWPVRDEEYDNLPTLGVPLTLVYGNVLHTISKVNFKINPKDYIKEHNDYCDKEQGDYDVEKMNGDGTVPVTSAVTVGTKMALDFEEGKPGAKPVTFVDVCSEYETKKSPFTSMKKNGEKVFDKNGYVGIPCDCTESKTKHCSHNGMLWLPELVDFLSETLDYGVRSDLTPEIDGKPEEYFEDWVDNCRLFVSNFKDEVEVQDK